MGRFKNGRDVSEFKCLGCLDKMTTVGARDDFWFWIGCRPS